MRSGFLLSHTPLHSTSLTGHEIQQQHIVSASRNCEAVVIRLSEGATVKTARAQERQQQPPQCQLLLRSEQPSRNDSEDPN